MANPSSTWSVLANVANERSRQDQKWGPPSGRGHDFATWLAILTEEVGEVARDVLEYQTDACPATANAAREHMADELVQVAAVAVAWVESIRLASTGQPDNKKRDLSGQDLTDANLRGADLKDANLQQTNLHRADLSEACLMGADLRGANLTGAWLTRANLCGANLKYANLQDADLFFANLWGADLENTNLRGADLQSACLQEANLQRANLAGTRLYFAGLRGARLTGARLNWSSHELLAEVLRQAAGKSVEKRKIAGLVALSHDWCWATFMKRKDPLKMWALEELARWVQPGDKLPDEMQKYIEEAANHG